MVRTLRQRRGLVGGALAVLAAVCAVQRLSCLTAFAPAGSPPSGRARGAVVRGQGRPEGLALTQKWQQGIDTAFFDVDSSVEERLVALREVLLSPGEIAGSLRDAVVAVSDKGLTRGHAEALDAIFPPGTLARSDLDGLLAVVRQVPEVAGDLYTSGAVTVPEVVDTEETLEDVRSALLKVLSPEGAYTVADTAFDGLRKRPKALQEPPFEVFGTGDGYEVRRYYRFSLATRRGEMPETGLHSADAFSALTAHLMSGSQGFNMNLTLPMQIQYRIKNLEKPLSINFFVPPETTVSEPDVDIQSMPDQLLAIRRFPGIATAAEVKRQYELLIESLAETKIYEPYRQGYFSVIQYNPPYTIPWRRRNEIAIEVDYNAANQAIARRIETGQAL